MGLGSSGSKAFTKTTDSSASDSNTKNACRCQVTIGAGRNKQIYNLDKLTGQLLSTQWKSSAWSSFATNAQKKGYFLTVCGSYMKCGVTSAAMVQTSMQDTPLSGNVGGNTAGDKVFNGDNGNLGTCRQTIGSWNGTTTRQARAYSAGSQTGFSISFKNGGVCADSPRSANPPLQTAATVNFVCDPKVHGSITVQHIEPPTRRPSGGWAPCTYRMTVRTKCACPSRNGKPACKAMCKKPCAGATGTDASSSSRASAAAKANPPTGCGKYKDSTQPFGESKGVDTGLQDSGAIAAIILASAVGVCVVWYLIVFGFKWTPFQQLGADYVQMGSFKKNDEISLQQQV